MPITIIFGSVEQAGPSRGSAMPLERYCKAFDLTGFCPTEKFLRLEGMEIVKFSKASSGPPHSCCT